MLVEEFLSDDIDENIPIATESRERTEKTDTSQKNKIIYSKVGDSTHFSI